MNYIYVNLLIVFASFSTQFLIFVIAYKRHSKEHRKQNRKLTVIHSCQKKILAIERKRESKNAGVV